MAISPSVPELQAGRVDCIPLAQESGGRIWAHCRSDGLAWSDDDGASWKAGVFKFEVRPWLIDLRPGAPSVALGNDRSIWTSSDGKSSWRKFPIAAPGDDKTVFQRIRWDGKRNRILLWTDSEVLAAAIPVGNLPPSWISIAKSGIGQGRLGHAIQNEDGLLFLTTTDTLLRLDLQKGGFEDLGKFPPHFAPAGGWRSTRFTGSDALGYFFLGSQGKLARYQAHSNGVRRSPRPEAFISPMANQILWDARHQRLVAVGRNNDGEARVFAVAADLSWRELPRDPKSGPAVVSDQLFLPVQSKRGELLLMGAKGARLEVGVGSVTVLSRGLNEGRRLEGAAISPDGKQMAIAGWDGLVSMTHDGGRTWDTHFPLGKTNLMGLTADPGLSRIWVSNGIQVAEFSTSSGWTELPNNENRSLDKLTFDNRTQSLWAIGTDGVLRWDAVKRGWVQVHVASEQPHRLVFIQGTSYALAHIGKKLYLRELDGPFQVVAPRLEGLPALYAGAAIEVTGFDVGFRQGQWALWLIASFPDIPRGMPRKIVVRSNDLRNWRYVFPSEVDLLGDVSRSLVVVPESESLLSSNGNGANEISIDGGVSWDSVYGTLASVFVESAGATADGRLFLYGGSPNNGLDLDERETGVFGHLVKSDAVPSRLEAYRLSAAPTGATNTLELRFMPGRVCGVEKMKFELRYRLPGESAYRPLNARTDGSLTKEHVRLVFSLDGMGLQSGNRFDLRLETPCTDGSRGHLAYDLVGFRIGTLADRIPGGEDTLWVVAALVLFPMIGLTLYLLYPAGLLHARNFAWNSLADMLPSRVAWIPKVLLGVLLVPWLSLRPRVLRAWVLCHREAFQDAVERNPTAVAARSAYIPFPAVTVVAGKESILDRPSRRDAVDIIGNVPVLVDVVGLGGSGKTRFALEALRWFAATPTQGSGAPFVAPIWLDESIDNLSTVLDRHIKVAIGQAVDEKFRNALISSGSIVLVLDRFSEQSPETQKQLSLLWRDMSAGFLVITRRDASASLGTGLKAVVIKPLPLDQYTLPIFLAAYLRSIDVDKVLTTESEPAEIAARLGLTIHSVRRRPGMSGAAITPLLVTMFARTALEHRRLGGDLSDLPASLPEVFFRYVERLDRAGDNHDSQDPLQLRRALQGLGKVCLTKKTLLPAPFHRDEALHALAKHISPVVASDMLRKLEKCGVLQVETIATTQLLRFQLDPIAEFFGLFARANQCGQSGRRWRVLRLRLARMGERAESLTSTLAMIHTAYSAALGWAAQNWERGPESATALTCPASPRH